MKAPEEPRVDIPVRIKVAERWEWAHIREVNWGHIFCETRSSRLMLAYRLVDYGITWRYAVDDPEVCGERPATDVVE